MDRNRLISTAALILVSCKAPAAQTTPPEPAPTVAAAAPKEPSAPVDTREPAPAPEPPQWQPRDEDRVTPHQPLENAEALASFYDRLASIDDGGAAELVRVLHLGDSSIGADGIPGEIRGRFQRRFGDGGAGFVLLQRYMKNYVNRWARMEGTDWEFCYIAYLCKKDGHYGLGGTTFWSRGGATTSIRTVNEGLGSSVSRFEVWYHSDPRSGRLEIRVDSKAPTVIDTRSQKTEDRFHELRVEPGSHRIRLRATGHGRTRAYGVVLETDGPGVVWDSFSMLGAFTRRLLAFDTDHISAQIAQRDPDLLVLSYGGNDLRRVVTGHVTPDAYADEFVKVIEHLRSGKPQLPCLVTTIADHRRILTYDVKPEQVEAVIAAQRDAAGRAGCAIFDVYAAMGGRDSVFDWREKELMSPDMKHLSHQGFKLMGGYLYDALIAAYVGHRGAG